MKQRSSDMMARAQLIATPDIITAFVRDGAICLRGLLDPAELARLAGGIDANLAAPSPRAKVASQAGDPGFFIEDFCNWRDNEAYRATALDTLIPEVAGLLMQSPTVRLYHDHMLTKEPGTRAPTPWHQDQPYYNIDGRQNISFWIPVDPIGRENTLEFVAGSHLGPWLMPRSFRDQQAKWFPEGALADLPDIDALRRGSAEDAPRILGWALEPGDAVAFHMLTLHASPGAQKRRRVFSLRYIGADIIHAPRNWTTSPDFPGLAAELPAGAPMQHKLFPLILGDAR